MRAPTCRIEGCEKKAWTRGWCRTHYTRWRRHGDPKVTFSNREKPIDERFDEKWVADEAGCRRWIASVNAYGYGRFGTNASTTSAHRYAWTRVHGPVPDGKMLHHLCGVKSCVNPDHLTPLTPREHGKAHRLTHCPHGHSYSGTNLRIDVAGGRVCITCKKAGSKASSERKKLWTEAMKNHPTLF